jgi:Dienelactone hydrolase family
VKKPILMLHGTADDLTPIAPCREYAERLSKAGKSARIIEYPEAYHQFDAPVYRTALRSEQGLTPRRCRLEEGENGVILNNETKQPFSPVAVTVQRALQSVEARPEQRSPNPAGANGHAPEPSPVRLLGLHQPLCNPEQSKASLGAAYAASNACVIFLTYPLFRSA